MVVQVAGFTKQLSFEEAIRLPVKASTRQYLIYDSQKLFGNAKNFPPPRNYNLLQNRM